MQLNIKLCVLALAFGYVCSAQEGQPVLLSIDRGNGQYHKGDTANVFIETTGNSDVTCDIEVVANGKVVSKESGKSFKAGEKVKLYDFSYDVPTAVMVNAIVPGVKGYQAGVGMIFEAEGFRPGFEAPKDLAKFWRRQVAAVRKCRMTPVLTPVDSKKDGVKSFDLVVNMPEGRDVHAYLSMPEDSKAKSLPIIILPHGAGVRSSNLQSSVNWAAKGFIAIDVNAHGILNGQPSSYYDELNKGELADYRRRKVTDHESYYFRLMLLRAWRTLDYATTLKEWDGKHIVVYGSSQGGLQSIALAALDRRVSLCVPIVPAFSDVAGSKRGHSDSWPRPWSSKFGEDSPESRILPYYDAACLATLVKCPLYAEAGLIDTTCPSECVISTFNVVKSREKAIWTFPWRRHGMYGVVPEIKSLWSEQIGNPREEIIKKHIGK